MAETKKIAEKVLKQIQLFSRRANDQISLGNPGFVGTFIALGKEIQTAYQQATPPKATYKKLSKTDFDFNHLGISDTDINKGNKKKLKAINVAWRDVAVYEVEHYFMLDKNKRLKGHFAKKDRQRFKLGLRYTLFLNGLTDEKGQVNKAYNGLILSESEANAYNKRVSKAIANYYTLRQRIVRKISGIANILGAIAYAISISITVATLLSAVWPVLFAVGVGVGLVLILSPIFYTIYNDSNFKLFLNMFGRGKFFQGINEYYDKDGKRQTLTSKRKAVLSVMLVFILGFGVVSFFIMHATLLSLTSVATLGFLTSSVLFPPLVIILATFYAIFIAAFTFSTCIKALRLKNVGLKGIKNEVNDYIDNEFNSERAKARNKKEGNSSAFLKAKKVMTVVLLVLFAIGVVLISIVTLFLAAPAVIRGLQHTAGIMKAIAKISGYVLTMVFGVLGTIGSYIESIIDFAKRVPNLLLKHPLGLSAIVGLIGMVLAIAFIPAAAIAALVAGISAAIFSVATTIKLVQKGNEALDNNPVAQKAVENSRALNTPINTRTYIANGAIGIANSIKNVFIKIALAFVGVCKDISKSFKAMFSKAPSYQPADGDRDKILASRGRTKYLTTGELLMSTENDKLEIELDTSNPMPEFHRPPISRNSVKDELPGRGDNYSVSPGNLKLVTEE